MCTGSFRSIIFTEEKAQETWMEMDGETLAEIGKRNGAYLEEVAENERNLREENAKKSKEANLEKNSSVSEESKKINNTDKIENKDNSEMSEIIENSENHLNSETQPANTLPQSNIVLPHPILDLFQRQAVGLRLSNEQFLHCR